MPTVDIKSQSRGNYIRERVDTLTKEFEEQAAAEYDTAVATWLETLPRPKEILAYLAAHDLPPNVDSEGRWLDYDPTIHGGEFEATVATWFMTEQARVAAEHRAAEEAAAEREIQAAELARKQREHEEAQAARRDALQADRDIVKAAQATGEMTPEVMAAVLRIADAGAERLQQQ